MMIFYWNIYQLHGYEPRRYVRSYSSLIRPRFIILCFVRMCTYEQNLQLIRRSSGRQVQVEQRWQHHMLKRYIVLCSWQVTSKRLYTDIIVSMRSLYVKTSLCKLVQSEVVVDPTAMARYSAGQVSQIARSSPSPSSTSL